MNLASRSAFLAAALCAGTAVHAQPAAPRVTPGGQLPGVLTAAPATDNSVQVIVDRQRLSAGLGRWEGVTFSGNWRATPQDLVHGELAATRRFGVSGVFAGVGDTHTFNEDWYGSLAVGAGDGAFYLPRYRVDATLNRKFLSRRQLVGTIGLGYYRAPDEHADRTLMLGAAYYFESPWILEGGVRFNRSSPGSVDTTQQYVAATYGRAKSDLISARYTWGGEGYLAIGQSNQLVNFRSKELNLEWRHWFSAQTGVILGAVAYRNPLYHRDGINLGLFHEF
jgi:YaiO family outer membrane protein